VEGFANTSNIEWSNAKTYKTKENLKNNFKSASKEEVKNIEVIRQILNHQEETIPQS